MAPKSMWALNYPFFFFLYKETLLASRTNHYCIINYILSSLTNDHASIIEVKLLNNLNMSHPPTPLFPLSHFGSIHQSSERQRSKEVDVASVQKMAFTDYLQFSTLEFSMPFTYIPTSMQCFTWDSNIRIHPFLQSLTQE